LKNSAAADEAVAVAVAVSDILLYISNYRMDYGMKFVLVKVDIT
jgi:hypothetical protein